MAHLTTEQAATFKTSLLAQTDPQVVAWRASRNDYAIAQWYNETATPTFLAYRNDVRSEEIGNAWVGTDIDGMSALNMQRLQLLLQSAPAGIFDMTRSDRRAGFENPFGTNVSNASRVAMRLAFRRPVSRVERLFVTGTGTEAAPGLMAYIGPLAQSDVTDALGR